MQSSEAAQRLQRFMMPFLALSLALWLLCLAVMAFRPHVTPLDRFYWPFHKPYLRWWDFRLYMPRFAYLHSARFFSADPQLNAGFEYPAPMAVLYAAFYALGAHALAGYLGITTAAVLLLAGVVIVALSKRGVPPLQASLLLAGSMVLSYPLAFEYKFGNMEICVFVLNAFALIFWLRDRPMIAAVLFGVSGSLKIFPLIFIGLFISRRQYGAAVVSVLTAAAVNVLSLWYIGPTFAVAAQGIKAGLAANQEHYMRHYIMAETGFDHSIVGFAKMALHSLRINEISMGVLHIYLAVAALAGTVLYFCCVRKLPVLNQVLFLCVASVWLPPTSHDYTLIHLSLPWALFVLYTTEPLADTRRDRRLMRLFLIFAVLMSAEYEFGFRGIYMGAQIKCVALAVMAVVAVLWRFDSSLFDRSNLRSPADPHPA